MITGRRRPSCDGTSRMTRECHVRICERLGVKLPGPTRLVARVLAVPTALRNRTGDEGRAFEVGNQVLISSHRKLLASKAMVVNVAETPGHDPAGMVERGERKRTAAEVSKAD